MSRNLSALLIALFATFGLLTMQAGCRADSNDRRKADISHNPKPEPQKEIHHRVKPEDREKTKFGYVSVYVDSVPTADEESRYNGLTDEDFRIIAEELDVEVAAIKAVVKIEAGAAMKGFWAPGIPIINFDRTMYAKYRLKVPSTAGATGEKVPEGLTGYGLRQWTQLINARKTNAQGANMGTFWGMFQIGGFNYKLCGCSSVDEFVKLMSYSELEQLELFATLLINTGMVADLRAKRWAAFARKYNGPSYAKRGYHTKMASAYANFSKL